MALFNNKKETEEKIEEKWIWVDGFKGTKKDMTCNGYQYELGKRYDMPEDAEIVECHSGFHLCLKLEDVFGYYQVENDHRFFKVRALVRETDVATYGRRLRSFERKDKIVAKSIEFISECSIDEIFAAAVPEVELARWTDEDKVSALTIGIREASKIISARTLVNLGYSAPFADFLINNGMLSMAEAVGSQTDLSMDMKVWMIMTAVNRREATESQIRNLRIQNDMLRRSFNF
jgi:hypothetical protein